MQKVSINSIEELPNQAQTVELIDILYLTTIPRVGEYLLYDGRSFKVIAILHDIEAIGEDRDDLGFIKTKSVVGLNVIEEEPNE